MNKVAEATNLVPKELKNQIEKEVEEEYSNEDIREISQSGGILLCIGFILKLFLCLCCLSKKLNRYNDLSIKNNKRESTPFIERDIDPELGLGIIT